MSTAIGASDAMPLPPAAPPTTEWDSTLGARAGGAAGGFQPLGELPPEYQALEPYREIIDSVAEEYDMPASLLAAMIFQESSGDMGASSTNMNGMPDLGLMQMNQATFEGLPAEVTGGQSHSELLTDPELAIRTGAYFINQQIEEQGSLESGLAYYVSGSPDPAGDWASEYIPSVLGHMEAMGGALAA